MCPTSSRPSSPVQERSSVGVSVYTCAHRQSDVGSLRFRLWPRPPVWTRGPVASGVVSLRRLTPNTRQDPISTIIVPCMVDLARSGRTVEVRVTSSLDVSAFWSGRLCPLGSPGRQTHQPQTTCLWYRKKKFPSFRKSWVSTSSADDGRTGRGCRWCVKFKCFYL